MKVELSALAESEFHQAHDYLQTKSPQAALQFAYAIREALDRIAEFPEASETVSDGRSRRAVVRDFPYVVFYEIDGETVFVNSIFHTARNPSRQTDN